MGSGGLGQPRSMRTQDEKEVKLPGITNKTIDEAGHNSPSKPLLVQNSKDLMTQGTMKRNSKMSKFHNSQVVKPSRNAYESSSLKPSVRNSKVGYRKSNSIQINNDFSHDNLVNIGKLDQWDEIVKFNAEKEAEDAVEKRQKI